VSTTKRFLEAAGAPMTGARRFGRSSASFLGAGPPPRGRIFEDMAEIRARSV
jgi:hypothetical protein